MSVNKVVYGTTVLVDLTEDTVTADTLLKGATAHNAAGELITGTASGGISLTITVTVDSGATVTATKGDLSVTGVSENGTCVLTVPEAGTWTVTATKDGMTVSTTVNITNEFVTSISFTHTITLDGKFYHSVFRPLVLIYIGTDNTRYTSPQDIVITAGTSVRIKLNCYESSSITRCIVTLDGVEVCRGTSGNTSVTYTFTPTTDCTITASVGGSTSKLYGKADIVTNGEAQATAADLDMLL